MQVFSLFFKIIRKNMFLVIIYLGVFMLMTSIMLINIKKMTNTEEVKINTYLNIEEENEDTKNFLSFLTPYINQVDLKKKDGIDDALFWDEIDLSIEIPSNFYEEIRKGNQPLVMKSSPDSIESYSLVTKINQYFNLVLENIRLNRTSVEDALQFTTNQLINLDNTEVEIHSSGSYNGIPAMFNSGVYVICALTLLIVGIVSFELRKTDIARRLNISPLSITKRNLLLTLCYILITCIIVALIVGIGFIIFKEDMVHHIGYYIMNAFLFVIVMVCLALLLSSLFKSNAAFNCVNVVFPLGVSFLSGSMVDLSAMPSYTKFLGRFFPNIYIVEANNYIGSCMTFQFSEYLKLVWPCFCFIILFASLTVLITKRMAKKEN